MRILRSFLVGYGLVSVFSTAVFFYLIRNAEEYPENPIERRRRMVPKVLKGTLERAGKFLSGLFSFIRLPDLEEEADNWRHYMDCNGEHTPPEVRGFGDVLTAESKKEPESRTIHPKPMVEKRENDLETL